MLALTKELDVLADLTAEEPVTTVEVLRLSAVAEAVNTLEVVMVVDVKDAPNSSVCNVTVRFRTKGVIYHYLTERKNLM